MDALDTLSSRNMMTLDSAQSSIVRGMAFAWVDFAVLWLLALTGVLATAIWVAPVFAVALIATFILTVVKTVRALLYIRRSASTSRFVRRVAVLSTVGVVGQLLLMVFSILGI